MEEFMKNILNFGIFLSLIFMQETFLGRTERVTISKEKEDEHKRQERRKIIGIEKKRNEQLKHNLGEIRERNNRRKI
jgi:low affinity Fe/Cu permease